MLRPAVYALPLAALILAGCDMLGLDSPEKLAAAREAEGKAVGAACRHAGRALEDCFMLNKRVDKAAIFAGWRDMNDYMRENKIENVAPVVMPQTLAAKSPDSKADSAKDTDEKGDKPEKPDATEAKAKTGKDNIMSAP